MGLTESRVAELIQAGGLTLWVFRSLAPLLKRMMPSGSTPISPKSLGPFAFFREKMTEKVLRPKIHFVFLMVKDNIHEVPSVPSFAKESGIEEVVLTNILSHTINQWQQRYSLGE